MNNIAAAKQALTITAEGKYETGGKTVTLPETDTSAVEVITPEEGERLIGKGAEGYKRGIICRISVTNEDSFAAAARYENALVMNFANAHHAGGGFLLGANAQEESLCRCSTLYASINSDKAGEMYRYNNTHLSRTESDYMLISPNVCVFRKNSGELLEKPFMTGVVTIPAPNRRGAALIASKKLIEETMTRRIRIMLTAAAERGYDSLILGAWGCGAFGNSPEDVAGYFRKVLIDEELGKCFDEVCFAVYGSEDGKNITAFREAFR